MCYIITFQNSEHFFHHGQPRNLASFRDKGWEYIHVREAHDLIVVNAKVVSVVVVVVAVLAAVVGV